MDTLIPQLILCSTMDSSSSEWVGWVGGREGGREAGHALTSFILPRDLVTLQRRQYETNELLGKVFTSWQRRVGAKPGGDVPVNSKTIEDLKRTARLLHYCTSPLLLARSHAHQTDMPVSSMYIQYQ